MAHSGQTQALAPPAGVLHLPPALGRTVGIRVLLPGIPAEVSPVIHLYHGGGDDF